MGSMTNREKHLKYHRFNTPASKFERVIRCYRFIKELSASRRAVVLVQYCMRCDSADGVMPCCLDD